MFANIDVIEVGDHETLMTSHGLYRKLFEVQAQRYRDDADNEEADDRL